MTTFKHVKNVQIPCTCTSEQAYLLVVAIAASADNSAKQEEIQMHMVYCLICVSCVKVCELKYYACNMCNT